LQNPQLSLIFSCSSSQSNTSPLILPIGKDPITNNIFYTSLGIGTLRHNFDIFIDLGGAMLWYERNNRYISSTYTPLPCKSKFGTGLSQSRCNKCNGPSKLPGCTNNTCGSAVRSPLNNNLCPGEIGDDVLFVSNSKVLGLFSGCTNSDEFSGDFPLKGFPKAEGILGLGRTQLALPKQLSLSSHDKLPNKFALCLTSSNKKGLGNLFIGGVTQQNSSFSKFQLTTTPLIINPVALLHSLI